MQRASIGGSDHSTCEARAICPAEGWNTGLGIERLQWALSVACNASCFNLRFVSTLQKFLIRACIDRGKLLKWLPRRFRANADFHAVWGSVPWDTRPRSFHVWGTDLSCWGVEEGAWYQEASAVYPRQVKIGKSSSLNGHSWSEGDRPWWEMDQLFGVPPFQFSWGIVSNPVLRHTARASRT